MFTFISNGHRPLLTSHETTYAVSERVRMGRHYTRYYRPTRTTFEISRFRHRQYKKYIVYALDKTSVREYINVKIVLEPGNASVISLEYRPK